MNVGHSECGEELRFLIEEFTFLGSVRIFRNYFAELYRR